MSPLRAYKEPEKQILTHELNNLVTDFAKENDECRYLGHFQRLQARMKEFRSPIKPTMQTEDAQRLQQHNPQQHYAPRTKPPVEPAVVAFGSLLASWRGIAEHSHAIKLSKKQHALGVPVLVTWAVPLVTPIVGSPTGVADLPLQPEMEPNTQEGGCGDDATAAQGRQRQIDRTPTSRARHRLETDFEHPYLQLVWGCKWQNDGDNDNEDKVDTADRHNRKVACGDHGEMRCIRAP